MHFISIVSAKHQSAIDIALLRLEEARRSLGRPEELHLMTTDQLLEEKVDIKTELKEYDTTFLKKYGFMVLV